MGLKPGNQTKRIWILSLSLRINGSEVHMRTCVALDHLRMSPRIPSYKDHLWSQDLLLRSLSKLEGLQKEVWVYRPFLRNPL